MRVPASHANESAASGGTPEGYGGPVVHWWRDSIRYCGPGFDWRYEGIICGYLALFERTGDRRWLQKARRAGHEIVASQLPAGTFPNSRFEQNPGTAGTPHEFAVDAALLALARTLRRHGVSEWERFLEAARFNVERFCIRELWDERSRSFRDDRRTLSFVPNKACTLAEALFLLTNLTGDSSWVERYALPTLKTVIQHQVRRAGDPLDGAIAQNSIGGLILDKYFPFYAARCVTALLEAHRYTGAAVYVDAAMATARFLRRWQDPDGGWPQVLYPGGRINRYPRWIAGASECFRALALVSQHTSASAVDRERERALALSWLATGELPGGTPRTASGFGSQVSQRPTSVRDIPDARDLMPVSGWSSMAFRYLASLDWDSGPPVRETDTGSPGEPYALACTWRGEAAVFQWEPHEVVVRAPAAVYYRWKRTEVWAEAWAAA